jgi:tetratricopeptide (TPR) repeat protein
VYTDCNIGEILSDQGRFEEAAVHLRRASRVGAAIGDSQSVAFVDVLLGRLAVRDGRYAEGLAMLERAVTALSRFRMDADAHFARAVIAEATALGGDPARALELASRELETGDKQLPLLLRAAGIAHARLGRPQDSRRVLADALVAARDREAPYELAATIEALAALGSGTDELIEEQRALLGRLKVERLPSPQLA